MSDEPSQPDVSACPHCRSRPTLLSGPAGFQFQCGGCQEAGEWSATLDAAIEEWESWVFDAIF